MNLPYFVRWATGIRWQWKVFIPILAVLGLSVLAIFGVLRTRDIRDAQWILIAAVCFAIILCFVLLAVLLVLIEPPLEELLGTIEKVRRGDLAAHVEFAKREDDIGQLGKQFNEMVQQLEQNRNEIEELHSREMARAQHLATLGELAAGLGHEIRNPLAGIAGVVDVIGKELPADSPSRGVLGEVRAEILHIQAILNDLLSYARPRPPNLPEKAVAHAFSLAQENNAKITLLHVVESVATYTEETMVRQREINMVRMKHADAAGHGRLVQAGIPRHFRDGARRDSCRGAGMQSGPDCYGRQGAERPGGLPANYDCVQRRKQCRLSGSNGARLIFR